MGRPHSSLCVPNTSMFGLLSTLRLGHELDCRRPGLYPNDYTCNLMGILRITYLPVGP